MLIALAKSVQITASAVNVRTGNGKQYAIIGIAKKGDVFDYLKETASNGWHLIAYKDQKAWVSG